MIYIPCNICSSSSSSISVCEETSAQPANQSAAAADRWAHRHPHNRFTGLLHLFCLQIPSEFPSGTRTGGQDENKARGLVSRTPKEFFSKDFAKLPQFPIFPPISDQRPGRLLKIWLMVSFSISPNVFSPRLLPSLNCLMNFRRTMGLLQVETGPTDALLDRHGLLRMQPGPPCGLASAVLDWQERAIGWKLVTRPRCFRLQKNSYYVSSLHKSKTPIIFAMRCFSPEDETTENA